MTITKAIRDLILSLGDVTALVGQKVYVLMLPQSVMPPAVRVQRISGNEDMHLRGVNDLRTARIQVDSVGSGGATAEDVDAAIHAGLRGYRGVVGEIDIRLIEPVSVRSLYDADELKQYKVARDYQVNYKDAAA